MMLEINQQILKELVFYNPDTGIFTWKQRDLKWFKSNSSYASFNNRFANKQAGYNKEVFNGKKYVYAKVFNKTYLCHRLAFLYMTGKFPENEVDHIDQNGLNNKWSNLKDKTHQENMMNKKCYKNNKLSLSGISFRKDINKYRVRLSVNGSIKSFGNFHSLEKAKQILNSARIKYGYHNNHGQVCISMKKSPVKALLNNGEIIELNDFEWVYTLWEMKGKYQRHLMMGRNTEAIKLKQEREQLLSDKMQEHDIKKLFFNINSGTITPITISRTRQRIKVTHSPRKRMRF